MLELSLTIIGFSVLILILDSIFIGDTLGLTIIGPIIVKAFFGMGTFGLGMYYINNINIILALLFFSISGYMILTMLTSYIEIENISFDMLDNEILDNILEIDEADDIQDNDIDNIL